MRQKIQVVYEKGVLRPLEPVEDLQENQILLATLEEAAPGSRQHGGQPRIVQLGGILKNHSLTNIEEDLKKMRAEVWKHVDNELNNE